MRPISLVLLAAAALAACERALPPGDEIAQGTWGGEDSGLIVQQGAAHLHIGCTFGDFAAPIPLDGHGRFSVSGSYMLRAYPVAVGPSLPATFTGLVRGEELTVGVTVNDTVRDETVSLGPVTLVLGRDPRMGPCPICLEPPTMVSLR
jgi:hypothetical protein